MRPSRDEMMLEIAGVVSTRSTCSRAHVGAVVAREGRILVSGYNGAPAGMRHCDHTREVTKIEITGHSFVCQTWREDVGYCICDYGKITVSEGCQVSVHAEANCVAYAARFGIDLSDSTIYTTLTPCLSCAQLIVNSGMGRVVCSKRYRDMMGVDLLRNAGLVVDIIE